jgi:hypothetical protein
MTEARSGSTSGVVTVLDGATTAEVVFASAVTDTNYDVHFQPLQVGTYDTWASPKTMLGFRLNISPAAEGNVRLSYVATPHSFGDVTDVVTAIHPYAWFRYGLGITETGGLVSQWDDQSGNARHLKQSVGTNQPTLEVDGSILFDGIDNFLKCDAFPLVQPTVVYILFKQVTWVESAAIFDGDTDFVGLWYQSLATPQLQMYSGITGAISGALAVDTYGACAVVFSGADSLIQVDGGTPVTGNSGTLNMDGFTLGRQGGSAANYSNIRVKEIIIASTLDPSVVEYMLSIS